MYILYLMCDCVLSSIIHAFICSSLVCCLCYFTGVDFKIKMVEVGGKKINLTIWDTGI